MHNTGWAYLLQWPIKADSECSLKNRDLPQTLDITFLSIVLKPPKEKYFANATN